MRVLFIVTIIYCGINISARPRAMRVCEKIGKPDNDGCRYNDRHSLHRRCARPHVPMTIRRLIRGAYLYFLLGSYWQGIELKLEENFSRHD
ncbi:hypothetical protein PUN28_008105 [Cardiocondyla obscurior]|uniref:Secreted protein n=1 Tax=Cardiocondyla obscurior TaxID=286306 RepID=A0AAW2FW62_9HYME